MNYLVIPAIVHRKRTDEQIAEEIINVAAYVYNVDVDVLRSKIRLRRIIEPRRMAAYYIRKQTKLSLSVIGKHIGGFDHATVLHHCRVYSDLLEHDKPIKGYDTDFRGRYLLAGHKFEPPKGDEVWMDIDGYRGEYQVSTTGKIRTFEGEELPTIINKNGNLAVKTSEPFKQFIVCRMVAHHFIKEIHNKTKIIHKDGNRMNNHVSNLAIVTN